MMSAPRENVVLSFSIKSNWEAAPEEIGYTVTNFDGHEFEHGRIVIDHKFISGVSIIHDDLNKHLQKYIHCNTLHELKNKIHTTWLEKRKEYAKVFAVAETYPDWIRIRPVYGGFAVFGRCGHEPRQLSTRGQ